MILTKTVKRTIHKKDGTNEDVEEMSVNVDFWKSIKEPVNIVLDEAHTILNSRRSFSKKSIHLNHWLSLIRRVLGDTDGGNSEIVFISQLSNKLDCNLRQMAHNIRWNICHYQKVCSTCGIYWDETSDQPELIYRCPRCSGIHIKKKNIRIQVLFFANIKKFEDYHDFGVQSQYKEILVLDVEKYFYAYNSLQWDNLFNEY